MEESAFGRVREALARRYRNANMRPEQAANYARLFALRAAMWHVDAVLPHVEAATPADLQVGLWSQSTEFLLRIRVSGLHLIRQAGMAVVAATRLMDDAVLPHAEAATPAELRVGRSCEICVLQHLESKTGSITR